MESDRLRKITKKYVNCVIAYASKGKIGYKLGELDIFYYFCKNFSVENSHTKYAGNWNRRWHRIR